MLVVDERYEQMRARLLAALADHERGDLDHAGLQVAVGGLGCALGNSHAKVREALFEADVALEHAQSGHTGEGSDPTLSLKRIRRNLREALA